MPGSSRWPSPLSRAFLARFFETESGAGSHDVKAAVIWMMAGLAAPGFVLPVLLLGWDWSIIGREFGPEVLGQVAWPDKLMYIGLSMVATGLVGALAWNRMLIDRRDALILGALPVRPASVVRAKFVSLAIYVLGVAAAMHTLSSLTLGGLLSAGQPAAHLRGIAAHFGASFLASAFVLISVVAAQAVLAVLFGARGLSRTSAWLQAALVASVLVLLVSLPAIGRSVWSELGGPRAYQNMLQISVEPGLPADVQKDVTLSPWLERLPPVWFFGLYETIRGTHITALHAAARTGLAASGVMLFVAILGLPLAYRRVMAASVEANDGPARRMRLGTVPERLIALQGGPAAERGMAQMLLLSAARVPRHRFVLAAALGAAFAWALPVLLQDPASAGIGSARPSIETAALPFWVMTVVVVAMRVVAALPADLQSGWMLAMLDPPESSCRAALRRTLWTTAIAPVVIGGAVLAALGWGATLAVEFAALSVATGFLLTEAMLIGYGAPPCAHAWQQEQPLFRRYWAVLAAPVVLTLVVPGLALARGVAFPVTAIIVLLALLTWSASRRSPASLTRGADPHDAAFRVLGLD